MATVLDFLQGRVPTKPECSIVNAALVAEHAVSSSSSSSSSDDEEEEFSTSTMRRKRKIVVADATIATFPCVALFAKGPQVGTLAKSRLRLGGTSCLDRTQ